MKRKKLFFICGVALFIAVVAFIWKAGAALPLPQASQELAPDTVGAADSASRGYMFYAEKDGLYRFDTDGSDKTLIEAGGYTRLLGDIDGRVYYIDAEKTLFETDESGRQETPVADSVLDAAIVGKTVYYIQSKYVFSVDSTGSAKQVMEMPADILALPFNLKTDGTALYICTYLEYGLGSVYECDFASAQAVLKQRDVSCDPFAFYQGAVIQMDNGAKAIVRKDLETGSTEKLTGFSGILYDMGVYGDWLVYICRAEDESQNCLCGFDMDSGKTFELKCGGDHIVQVLSSVFVIDSDESTASVLMINGDTGYLKEIG